MGKPEYATVTLIVEDSHSISTTTFLQVPSVDVEELYEPDTRQSTFIFTIKPEPKEVVGLVPGEQVLYTVKNEEKPMLNINDDLVPGWYEWFSSPELPTYIAHVQEDGEIYLPEVNTTYVQFCNAVNQGHAYRMLYADRSGISEPIPNKMHMALALAIISNSHPGYLDPDILKNGKYLVLADHILDIIKTLEE